MCASWHVARRLKQAFLSKIASFLTRHGASVLSELTVTLGASSGAAAEAAEGDGGDGGEQRIRYDQASAALALVCFGGGSAGSVS